MAAKTIVEYFAQIFRLSSCLLPEIWPPIWRLLIDKYEATDETRAVPEDLDANTKLKHQLTKTRDADEPFARAVPEDILNANT